MSDSVMLMNLREIVLKLTGPIEPCGDSHVDALRLRNLRQLTKLVDDLLVAIEWVAKDATSHEASVRQAGEYARAFLDSWGEMANDKAEGSTA